MGRPAWSEIRDGSTSGFPESFLPGKSKEVSSTSVDALKSLKWIPLAGRRFDHQCFSFQNAIKGNILEHFECYRSTLSQSQGHNTRNGQLPRLPKPSTELLLLLLKMELCDGYMVVEQTNHESKCDPIKSKLKNDETQCHCSLQS